MKKRSEKTNVKKCEKKFLNSLGPNGTKKTIHISISDEGPYAIAQVIIEAL